MTCSRRRMSVPRDRAIRWRPQSGTPLTYQRKRRSVGVGLDGSVPPLKAWDVSGSLRESDRAAGARPRTPRPTHPGSDSVPVPTFSECRQPQPLPDHQPRGLENAKTAGRVAYGGDTPPPAPGVSRTRNPPGGSPPAGPPPRPPPPRRRNASRHSPTGGRTVGLIPARPGRYPNTDRLVLCGYPPVCGGPMTEPSPVTTSALPQRNLNRDPGHLEKPDRQFRPLPIDGSRAVLGPPSARSASVRLPGSR